MPRRVIYSQSLFSLFPSSSSLSNSVYDFALNYLNYINNSATSERGLQCYYFIHGSFLAEPTFGYQRGPVVVWVGRVIITPASLQDIFSFPSSAALSHYPKKRCRTTLRILWPRCAPLGRMKTSKQSVVNNPDRVDTGFSVVLPVSRARVPSPRL